MSGTYPGQSERGVPAAEAAKLLGLNYEALRKRIKRGTLPAYKEGDRWYVMLNAIPDTSRVEVWDILRDTGGIAVPDNQVTPAEVERAINSTTDRYTRHLDAIRESLERAYTGQLAAKDQTIAALDAGLTNAHTTIATQTDMIAELRRRAEAAEAEREELLDDLGEALASAAAAMNQKTHPAPAPMPAIEAVDVSPAPFTPAPRRWWRRIFGGG